MKIEDGLPLNPLDEAREVRVARGVALLDEKAPDWRTQVNPDTLDMCSDTACVLGQIYGRYGSGMVALGLTSRTQGTRYGFDSWTDRGTLSRSDDNETRALTAAWRAELTRTTTPAE